MQPGATISYAAVPEFPMLTVPLVGVPDGPVRLKLLVMVGVAVPAVAAGQVMVAVVSPGVVPSLAVRVQVNVAVCSVDCGVHCKPTAGALAPTVAGALIVRVAPAVTAKPAEPAGMLQLTARSAVAEPAVATSMVTVPVRLEPETVDRVVPVMLLMVGDTAPVTTTGQVKARVKSPRAGVSEGVGVCTQVIVPLCGMAAGVQVTPIDVKLPPVAGIVWTAGDGLIVKPELVVQERSRLPVPVPSVTVPVTLPVPPVSVRPPLGPRATVGAVLAGAPVTVIVASVSAQETGLLIAPEQEVLVTFRL